MIATFLIAIAAGAASALMFASIISRALISLLLFYLASLPLMVAAMGWGPLCATIGGIAAALGLGAFFGLPYMIAYVITVALPAWWLGHLAMLGRPADASPAAASSPLEWYPPGRILLWISGFAVLTTIATLLTFFSDDVALMAVIKRGLIRVLAMRGLTTDERAIDTLAAIVPVGMASGPTITLSINLWLAAKITAASGRLHRPWPDLKATTLPPMTLVALCVAIAFCFTGGLFAVFAKVTAGALLMAYALTGFAVMHTLTQGLRNRAVWLICSYAVMIILIWPLLSMVILGLADAIFGFRERFMRKRPPPLPAS